MSCRRDDAALWAAIDAGVQRWAKAVQFARDASDAYESGLFEDAIQHLDLAVDKGLAHDADVRSSRAITLLTVGRLQEGFQEYESRIEDALTYGSTLKIAAPLWSGDSIDGRRLCVWKEQGHGDVMLFARFLPELQRRGAKVTVVVPPELVRLFRGSFDVDVVSNAENCEGRLHCLVGSLPHLLGVSESSELWRGPYLQVAEPNPELSLQPSADLKVGVCWAGSERHRRDHHRSVKTASLAPLWRIEGVRFFPLCMPPDDTRPVDGDASWWVDMRKSIHDFADTAALMQQLDLVITVDTAVANLAGALGLPAWVFVPHVPDWRWGATGSRSAWYPSLRLWRQAAPGDWGTVIEQVTLELRSLVRVRRPAPVAVSSALPSLKAPTCKCCSGVSRWFGVVSADYLTYSYTEADRTEGSFDYWRCEACGFLFSTHFDDWSDERMRTELYNDEFFQLDDGWRQRPNGNAVFLEVALRPIKESVHLLDYGGGRGLLAERLKDCGFEHACSYDPFYDPTGRPVDRVDIATAFEVLEHAVDPHAMLIDIDNLLRPDGGFVFSTLVQPTNIEEIGLSWWYAKPRVGHVSLHSRTSLAHCAARRGWTFESFAPHLHAMYRVRPRWMQHLASAARGSILVGT